MGMISIFWIQNLTHSKWLDKKPKAHGQSLQFIKKELNLTDQQFEQYQILRQKHEEQSKAIQDELQEIHIQIMEGLFIQDPQNDFLFEQMGELNIEKELLTFSHFQDLQNLLGIEQEVKLRALLKEYFLKNRPMPPRMENQGPPHHLPHHEQKEGHRPPRPKK